MFDNFIVTEFPGTYCVPLWMLGRGFELVGTNRIFFNKIFFFNTGWEVNIEVSNIQESNTLCASREVSKSAREAVALPQK